MAKAEKIDVHNRGSRTYTTPSGIHLQGGQTTQLDADEAESMMKGYPADLISPDSLRSVSSAQSNSDQHKLIVELQAKVTELEKAGVSDPKGIKRIDELETALKTALATNAELAGKNDELTKALDDAKAMVTTAYQEVDALKAQLDPQVS